MPTPKIWNNLSIKLLPYWVIFTTIAVSSFLTFLVLLFRLKFSNEVDENYNHAPEMFLGLVYLWSFGLLLISMV